MTALTYTVAELAEALGISERHLRRLAKAGDIPVLNIPGRTLFSRAAIDAWLARSAA